MDGPNLTAQILTTLRICSQAASFGSQHDGKHDEIWSWIDKDHGTYNSLEKPDMEQLIKSGLVALQITDGKANSIGNRPQNESALYIYAITEAGSKVLLELSRQT